MPDNHSWALWQQGLTGFHQLHQLLEQWFAVPASWPSFYDSNAKVIYHFKSSCLISYRSYATGHATRRQRYIRHLQVTLLPPAALPTTTYGTSAIVHHTGTAPSIARAQHPDSKWWGQVLTGPTDLPALLAGFSAGTAVCVTAGSYKAPFGTTAYTLKSAINATDEFTLVNPTPGHPDDIDPYLAKLAGLYGCLATVDHLCANHHITTSGITIGCDCQSILTNTFHLPSEKIKPAQAHSAMLQATRRLLLSSPLRWTNEHIYSHQDCITSYDNLDPWAQLNVDMDMVAKQYWTHLHNSQFEWFSFPSVPNEWSLWNLTYCFPSWDMALAHQHLYNRATSAYWQKKLNQTGNTPIDWDSSGMAFKTLTLYQQLWVPKWLTLFISYRKNVA